MEGKQSSKVTNFMRMVGSYSRSVDYRVITILTAPGYRNGWVTLKLAQHTREQEYTITLDRGKMSSNKRENIPPLNS